MQPLSVNKLHPGRAAALHDQPTHLRTQPDGQVPAVAIGREIGHRGGRSPSVALGQLVEADAILYFAVDIRVAWNAQVGGRCEIGLADGQGRARFADAQRAAPAMKPVVMGFIVLCLAEVGQHVVIAPACTAHLTPVVIVLRIATGVNLRVDRRSAADDLGLRVAEHLVLHVPLGNRLPPPTADALGHFGKACRQMIEGVAVTAAGLQQQHLRCGVFRQAPRQNRAGRAAADDDEIVSFGHPALLPWVTQALSVRYGLRPGSPAPPWSAPG